MVPPATPTCDVTSGNLRFFFELPDTHQLHLRYSHDLSTRAYGYYSLRSYSYSPYYNDPTSLPTTHNLRPTIYLVGPYSPTAYSPPTTFEPRGPTIRSTIQGLRTYNPYPTALRPLPYGPTALTLVDRSCRTISAYGQTISGNLQTNFRLPEPTSLPAAQYLTLNCRIRRHRHPYDTYGQLSPYLLRGLHHRRQYTIQL